MIHQILVLAILIKDIMKKILLNAESAIIPAKPASKAVLMAIVLHVIKTQSLESLKILIQVWVIAYV
jgi:hypothetical protein